MSISRSVVSAVSWLSFGNILVRALSLVIMPILTRYLSPQAYGEAALVWTVVSLASVFALAGIDMGYARHIFSGQLGGPSEVEAFCWRWTLAAASTIALLVGLMWWLWASAFDFPASLAGFAAFGVLTSAMAVLSQTRARLANRYVRMSWVQFATGCTGAVLSVSVAVFWRQDAWAPLVALMAGCVMPVLLLGVPSWRQLATPSGLNPLQRRRLLTTGLAGVVTAPAYWVLTSSDRWFLASFHDSGEVGIYSVGCNVGTVGAVVSAAITNAWLPELGRAESTSGRDFAAHKARVTQLLVAILMIVTVAVAAAGGDVIRALADRRFHAGAVVVPWVAAGVFFYGVLHLGNALLVLVGKLHWAGWAWCIALLASLSMNRWLIPAQGALGAAITQAVSFLLVMLLVWAAALRFESLRLHWPRLAAGFVLSVAVAALMQMAWAPVAWHSLVLKLPMGLIYAAACLWIVAPEMFTVAIRKLDRRGVA